LRQTQGPTDVAWTPETVVTELIEHHTPINYLKGSMIFLEGAPTDLIYWVSSGLVDILCPEPDGNQIQASLLGPGISLDSWNLPTLTESGGKPFKPVRELMSSWV